MCASAYMHASVLCIHAFKAIMPEHTPAPTPARSLYGFLMYLLSKTVLALYCIWAIIPNDYLHYLNIYYYPQKYWATAIPIQCLVGLTLFAFIVYPSSNFMLTSNIDNNSTLRDSFSQPYNSGDRPSHTPDSCVCKNSGNCLKDTYLATYKEHQENMVPQLHDLDIRFISKKLYLNKSKCN